MSDYVRSIAIVNGVVATAIGIPFSIAGAMVFTNITVTSRVKVLGVAGLSTIPLAILATYLTIKTNELKYQLIHTVAPCVILTGFILNNDLEEPITQDISVLQPLPIPVPMPILPPPPYPQTM